MTLFLSSSIITLKMCDNTPLFGSIHSVNSFGVLVQIVLRFSNVISENFIVHLLQKSKKTIFLKFPILFNN